MGLSRSQWFQLFLTRISKGWLSIPILLQPLLKGKLLSVVVQFKALQPQHCQSQHHSHIPSKSPEAESPSGTGIRGCWYSSKKLCKAQRGHSKTGKGWCRDLQSISSTALSCSRGIEAEHSENLDISYNNKYRAKVKREGAIWLVSDNISTL